MDRAGRPRPVSVELVLIKWNFEADLATLHLPRKQRARARLLKVLEIARSDVACIPMGKDAAHTAKIAACRRDALAILEEYVPRYLARLPEGSI